MSTTLQVRRLHPDAKLPTRGDGSGRSGDAGLDLYSTESVVVPANGSASVHTGVGISLPTSTVGLIWSRSSLSSKFGIETGAGVIDENYTGEILIVLHNFGDRDYNVLVGSKIAQLLVQPVLYPEVVEVPSLNATARGDSGFGSTDAATCATIDAAVDTSSILGIADEIKSKPDVPKNAQMDVMMRTLNTAIQSLNAGPDAPPPNMGALFADLFGALGSTMKGDTKTNFDAAD